ncbi:MAG: TIGR03936 family radical SAM-associated protein [Lachnospiraceae bacterium]|nr:TIGR03936 family radical SAM-associated protein [Lachnospiraceae bacterium]
MKARIKFSKCGSMRFIGHLDVMRYFQKAFRRAGIPISYSQGFSPHQLMSFASPLGIGLSSDAEYMDLTLDYCHDPVQMVGQMNGQMNEEIRVQEMTILSEDAKSSMAMLAACDYMVAVKAGKGSFLLPEQFDGTGAYLSIQELLDAFLAQDQITILKKTKRSESVVDIRENIYVLCHQRDEFDGETMDHGSDSCLDGSADTPVLYMQLTAGSIVNIKPELVLQALADFAGKTYDPLAYQIHRMEMYEDADGKKGEIHTIHSEIPCRLVPLSYQKGADSCRKN